MSRYLYFYIFYILEDPTEHHNLSRSKTDLAKQLKALIRKMLKEEVPCIHRSPDPRGLPSRYNDTFASGWC